MPSIKRISYFESYQIQKQAVMLVELDVTGAYNNILIKNIVEALKSRGASKEYIRWNTLYRKVVTTAKGITRIRYPTKGTPQGSVCSPSLYNETCNSLYAE